MYNFTQKKKKNNGNFYQIYRAKYINSFWLPAVGVTWQIYNKKVYLPGCSQHPVAGCLAAAFALRAVDKESHTVYNFSLYKRSLELRVDLFLCARRVVDMRSRAFCFKIREGFTLAFFKIQEEISKIAIS